MFNNFFDEIYRCDRCGDLFRIVDCDPFAVARIEDDHDRDCFDDISLDDIIARLYPWQDKNLPNMQRSKLYDQYIASAQYENANRAHQFKWIDPTYESRMQDKK